MDENGTISGANFDKLLHKYDIVLTENELKMLVYRFTGHPDVKKIDYLQFVNELIPRSTIIL